jgi:hypothetical protein
MIPQIITISGGIAHRREDFRAIGGCCSLIFSSGCDRAKSERGITETLQRKKNLRQ